jgi:hypothetical protein
MSKRDPAQPAPSRKAGEAPSPADYAGHDTIPRVMMSGKAS